MPQDVMRYAKGHCVEKLLRLFKLRFEFIGQTVRLETPHL